MRDLELDTTRPVTTSPGMSVGGTPRENQAASRTTTAPQAAIPAKLIAARKISRASDDLPTC